MPLHGLGQRMYWLPDKFYTPVRNRANTFGDKEKRKRAEEIFIQQCKESIAQGNIEQDILNDQEEIFVPNKRARHRVPKTFSLANLTQKKNKTKQNQPDVQRTTNNKTSEQNKMKNTNQGTKKESVQKPKQQNANRRRR